MGTRLPYRDRRVRATEPSDELGASVQARRTGASHALEFLAPQDLPQVSIEITEVPGIDTSGAVVSRIRHRRSCGRRLGEHCVDSRFAGHRVADAELP